jgi:hypothetical protein
MVVREKFLKSLKLLYTVGRSVSVPSTLDGLIITHVTTVKITVAHSRHAGKLIILPGNT